MAVTIVLTSDSLHRLDLSPAQSVIESLLSQLNGLGDDELVIRFEVDYPLEPGDPRELSEIPEVRLWFIRLDADYPWLPVLLDWKAGELARYTAMLVPHQFHRTEGIQFNPEALEIFLMHKVFVIAAWLQKQGIAGQSKLISMAKLLGYDLEPEFFDVLKV